MIELSYGGAQTFEEDCRGYGSDWAKWIPHLTYDACERPCYLVVNGQNLLADDEGAPLVLPVMQFARSLAMALRSCAESGTGSMDLAKWWVGPDLALTLEGERVRFTRPDLHLTQTAAIEVATARAETFATQVVARLKQDCPKQVSHPWWAPFLENPTGRQ